LNEIGACEDFARAGDFDCFLLAGRYTLLEQAALDSFLPLCAERNISLMIGGPYNTGILATGAVEGAYYDYAPAPPEIMEKVRRIEAVCARHGVRLASAALQFPLGHERVPPSYPGAEARRDRGEQGDFVAAIPAGFWAS
jgi:D-threo-aldose 1-dehydrogenase